LHPRRKRQTQREVNRGETDLDTNGQFRASRRPCGNPAHNPGTTSNDAAMQAIAAFLISDLPMMLFFASVGSAPGSDFAVLCRLRCWLVDPLRVKSESNQNQRARDCKQGISAWANARRGRLSMSAELDGRVSYRFASFEVLPRLMQLRRNGVRLKLREQPFRILLLMIERPGELISRDELRRELWPDHTF